MLKNGTVAMGSWPQVKTVYYNPLLYLPIWFISCSASGMIA